MVTCRHHWETPEQVLERVWLMAREKEWPLRSCMGWYSTCHILDTIVCCDDCCLLLKIMHTCGANGLMQRVGSKGTLTTWWVGRGDSHMGQFNTDVGLDWPSISVRSTNNAPSKIFALLTFIKSSYDHVVIIRNKKLHVCCVQFTNKPWERCRLWVYSWKVNTDENNTTLSKQQLNPNILESLDFSWDRI